METMRIKPSRGYLSKLRLILTIVAFGVALFGFIMGMLIGIDEGPRVAMVVFYIFLAADLAWWLPAMIIVGYYFKSLSYEIQDDEVIVHVGIITKSVKHVPYRTVTNITARRGLFDRYLFNIGSLNIQTAGMSAQAGAEESLVGLPDVKGVYEVIVEKLRRFRGGMTPDQAGIEDSGIVASSAQMEAILDELKEIRKNTTK
ncbi:MAG: PH domain-containing protein [Candidatus Krumholzibacteriota bacterium]|nr:PH domain-containing protein [Candidatus Krumholzibacteriota bacterium]